jgi:hypothetical protein
MRGYELEHETLIPAKPEPKKEHEKISTHHLEVILFLLVFCILLRLLL